VHSLHSAFCSLRPVASGDSSPRSSGGARLFSHSLINVEAVLVNLPGDNLAKEGQGMSPCCEEESEVLLGRGVVSTELLRASV